MTDRRTLAAYLPYLAWMAMLFTLPSGAGAYALRTALVAGLLGWTGWAFRREIAFPKAFLPAGVVAGLVVLALWIGPERFELYRRLFTYATAPAGPSPYDPAVCGTFLFTARLLGSACVIAPAEELFFRFFLYRRLQSRDWTSVSRRTWDLSAFLWSTGLFALEHDRWLAGAVAGAIYLETYRRWGLAAAVTAHVVTNLALGLWVLGTGSWGFW